MKYYVYGYYGFGNYGDQLILETIISTIAQKDCNAEFFIRSFDQSKKSLTTNNITYLTFEKFLMNPTKRLFNFFKYVRRHLKFLKKCDYLIIGGGTLFIDKGKFSIIFVLLLIFVLYCKFFNKKVIIMGIGIDLISNPINLILMKHIFKFSDFISVREIFAYDYLLNFRLDSNKIILSSDLIFANNKILEMANQSLLPNCFVNTKPSIGINIIDYFGTSNCNDVLRLKFKESIHKLIDDNKANYNFFYISLQEDIGNNDNFMYDELSNKIEYIHLTDETLPQIFNTIDYVITMRYHLALLSFLFRKKCLIINHELKFSDLSLELSIPSIYIHHFMYEDSAKIISYLINSSQCFDNFKLSKLKYKSLKNFLWLDNK
ncbi:MAG: polysaccharide pyruvyl transferase family protein [Caldisericum exile]|uniref:polysaccharide pyruvyl transferase family protein n=1 Tax=Caldisericum exile TaxID=693075 RepID=UPI003C754426